MSSKKPPGYYSTDEVSSMAPQERTRALAQLYQQSSSSRGGSTISPSRTNSSVAAASSSVEPSSPSHAAFRSPQEEERNRALARLYQQSNRRMKGSSSTPSSRASSPVVALASSNESSPPSLKQDSNFAERLLLTLEMSCLEEAQVCDLLKSSLPQFFLVATPYMLDRLWFFIFKSSQTILNAAFSVMPDPAQVEQESSYPLAVLDCMHKIRSLHLEKWMDLVIRFLENSSVSSSSTPPDPQAFHSVLQRETFGLFLNQAKPDILQRLVSWSVSTNEYELKHLVEWLPNKAELQTAKYPSEAISTAVCLLDQWSSRLATKYQEYEKEVFEIQNKKEIDTEMGLESFKQNTQSLLELQQEQMELLVRFNVVQQQILELAGTGNPPEEQQAQAPQQASQDQPPNGRPAASRQPSTSMAPQVPTTAASRQTVGPMPTRVHPPPTIGSMTGSNDGTARHSLDNEHDGDEKDDESLSSLDGIFC